MKKGTKTATVIVLIVITIGLFFITAKYRDSFASLISGLFLGFVILADITYVLAIIRVNTEQEEMPIFEQDYNLPEENYNLPEEKPKINVEKYAKECNAWYIKQERKEAENIDNGKTDHIYTAQDLKAQYDISFFRASAVLEHLINIGYINKDFCALCQDVTIELEIKRYLSSNTGEEEKRPLVTNGYEFEKYCASLLSKNGFEHIEVTSESKDQGIDIVAYRDNVKYGIQCKYYSGTVGNHAVQEAFSGAKFYDCHVPVVMTNSFFTDVAKELAQKNNVLLWDKNAMLKFETPK